MTDIDHQVPAERIVSQDAVDAAPIIYTDGPIGLAAVYGMIRITLGAEIFNADPAVDKPKLKPVANIIISRDAAFDLAQALLEFSADDEDEEHGNGVHRDAGER